MDYFCFILLLILTVCNNVHMVIVRTNEGLVKGLAMNLSLALSVDVNIRTYYSFRGIPYAEPPIGNLRFKAPIRHKPWSGIKQATSHGSICVQYDNDFQLYPNASENCLFINVYTTDLQPEKLKPVLVFTHGGRYKYGSGDDTLYGADYIVQKDVVLATYNYRLDSMGFLNLGIPEVPGNAGLKDQRLALEWIRDNICHFGGDPNQVTLMGQSAGSASVIYHMMSPLSRGLFHRAIAMSGVPFCEWSLTFKLKKRSFELVKLLGNDTDDPYEMLEFLQSLPALELINKFPIVIPEERNWNFGFKMTAFQPCPEEDYGQERFLVESATETLKSGNLTKVDLLIGYTSMEAVKMLPEILITNMTSRCNEDHELLIPRDILLGPNPIDRPALAEKIKQYYFGDWPIDMSTIGRLVQYVSDEVFVYNINRFIRHLDSEEFKIFLYKFSIFTSRNRYSGEQFGIHGVGHLDDLLYLFEPTLPTADDTILMEKTNKIERYIDLVTTMFTNFVKNGDPNKSTLGVTWEKYNNVDKPYLNINKTLTPGNYPDADANCFWTSIYEESGAELY